MRGTVAKKLRKQASEIEKHQPSAVIHQNERRKRFKIKGKLFEGLTHTIRHAGFMQVYRALKRG